MLTFLCKWRWISTTLLILASVVSCNLHSDPSQVQKTPAHNESTLTSEQLAVQNEILEGYEKRFENMDIVMTKKGLGYIYLDKHSTRGGSERGHNMIYYDRPSWLDENHQPLLSESDKKKIAGSKQTKLTNEKRVSEAKRFSGIVVLITIGMFWLSRWQVFTERNHVPALVCFIFFLICLVLATLSVAATNSILYWVIVPVLTVWTIVLHWPLPEPEVSSEDTADQVAETI